MIEKLTKTPPRRHQVEALERSLDKEAFAFFMEQGTGKTLVGIATFTHLRAIGEIEGVLILAPNGVHDNWVHIEIPKHCHMDERTMLVASWHSSDGMAKRNYFKAVADGGHGKLAVLAANIEAVRTETFQKTIQEFIKRPFLLIVDESTVVKNIKAEQTKETIRIADRAAYRRILTGTPVTQSPLDLYAQFRVLGKGLLPFDTWTIFKYTFAIEQTMHMGNRQFNKVVGYKNQQLLADCIAPHSFRVLKKDCLDLPPKVYVMRPVELTAEQKRIYRELAEQCLASLGENAVVTVTTVITMMLRLHQVILGYLPDDTTKKLVPIPHKRLDALLSLLEDNPGKAIIFCRFLEDVRQVCNMLDPARTVVYTGDENTEKRTAAVDAFQNEENIRWFVCTSAAARGLTLTAAEQVIYYSQSYSLETRLQSEDRAHRDGQQKTVVYTDLVAPGTVEESIIKALLAKRELAAGVMDRAALAQMIQPA